MEQTNVVHLDFFLVKTMSLPFFFFFNKTNVLLEYLLSYFLSVYAKRIVSGAPFFFCFLFAHQESLDALLECYPYVSFFGRDEDCRRSATDVRMTRRESKEGRKAKLNWPCDYCLALTGPLRPIYFNVSGYCASTMPSVAGEQHHPVVPGKNVFSRTPPPNARN